MAIGLLGVATVILGTMYSGVKISRINQGDLIALSVAQRKIDELRGTPFNSLSIVTDQSFTDDDLSKLRSSSGQYSVAYYDADSDGSIDEDIKLITVNVSWTENGMARSKILRTLSSSFGIAGGGLSSEGLVGWWTFDTEDMDNGVEDSSGNGLNGQLVGQPSAVPGILGEALSFDGQSDHVKIENNELLDQPAQTNELTVAAWTKLDRLPTNWGPAVHRQTGCCYGDWFYLGYNEAGSAYSVIFSTSSGQTSLSSSAPVC